MKRRLNALALSALLAAQSWAGTTTVNFNEDPATSGSFTNYGAAAWMAYGGVGVATNALDGYLRITAAASQQSAIVFQDFDNGAVVQGLRLNATCALGMARSSRRTGSASTTRGK